MNVSTIRPDGQKSLVKFMETESSESGLDFQHRDGMSSPQNSHLRPLAFTCMGLPKTCTCRSTSLNNTPRLQNQGSGWGNSYFSKLH
jgi:hypothetical protein